jgi:hypothetical protein
MLCDEESQIASYEVAVEACLIDLERKALPEIDPVTDATTRRRGKIAMQRHHPLQDLLLMPAAALA